MKSGLGIEKYDVCSNKHCSSTMCAIISLKVWIDINCAQTVDLKKKLYLSVSHRFTQIYTYFNKVFFWQKTLFLRPKISVFLGKCQPKILGRKICGNLLGVKSLKFYKKSF